MKEQQLMIFFLHRNLPSGMAFVEVENKDDLEKALKLSQHLTVDSR